jgi:hypothetical protein
LIEFGSDYFEFWDYIEIGMLSDECFSIFVENLRFSDLTSDIWMNIVVKFTKPCSDDVNANRFLVPSRSATLLRESMLISEFPSLFHRVKALRNKKWTLLYRGSRDGFRASDFHHRCNGQSNTVTIIHDNSGYLFGGFTPVAWDSTCSSSFKQDKTCESFLFTLKNPHGIAPRTFCQSDSGHTIYCQSNYGPTFGNHAIYVSDNCNQNNSSFTTLGNSSMIISGTEANIVFTGAHSFAADRLNMLIAQFLSFPEIANIENELLNSISCILLLPGHGFHGAAYRDASYFYRAFPL